MATVEGKKPVILGLCFGLGIGAGVGALLGSSVLGLEAGMFIGAVIGWIYTRFTAGTVTRVNQDD